MRLLVDLGFVGVALALGAFVATLLQAWRYVRFSRVPELGAALLGATVAGLVNSLFEDWLFGFGSASTVPFWFFLAMLSYQADLAHARVREAARRQQEQAQRRPGRPQAAGRRRPDRLPGAGRDRSPRLRRRPFLVRRLAGCAAAEGCHLLANLAPAAVAVPLWALAVRLNPHHHRAAAARARALLERGDRRSWPAFTALIAAIGNPADTSASDLYLTWIPGRIVTAAAAALLWGRGEDGRLRAVQGAELRDRCVRLAAAHFDLALRTGDLDRAAAALAAWRSLTGAAGAAAEPLEVRWAAAELAWVGRSGASEGNWPPPWRR